jgi:hypothetical protein
MQVELHCDRCGQHFTSSLSDAADQALTEIHAEGPWFALGDGETFEDRISARFSGAAAVPCRCCGAPTTLSEEGLGRLSRELLANW